MTVAQEATNAKPSSKNIAFAATPSDAFASLRLVSQQVV
jgi:hypothetical protein